MNQFLIISLLLHLILFKVYVKTETRRNKRIGKSNRTPASGKRV